MTVYVLYASSLPPHGTVSFLYMCDPIFGVRCLCFMGNPHLFKTLCFSASKKKKNTTIVECCAYLSKSGEAFYKFKQILMAQILTEKEIVYT